MTTPTQDQLEAWVREWQRTLRLQDWAVSISLKRSKDMVDPDTFGSCWVHHRKKRAVISVCDPNDAVTDRLPFDPEKTVVHELLHLHFEPFYDEKDVSVQTAQEQAIDLIAEGLITLKRKAETMPAKQSKPAAPKSTPKAPAKPGAPLKPAIKAAAKGTRGKKP